MPYGNLRRPAFYSIMQAYLRMPLILTLLFFSISSISFSASFDCTKAATSVEKAICSDAELSKLDDLLLQSYKKALENLPNADTLKTEQRSWLAKRDKCHDVACLKQAYNDRIASLGSSIMTGQIKTSKSDDDKIINNKQTSDGLSVDNNDSNQLPFGYVEKLGGEIWKDPKIKDRLIKVLGKSRFKQLTSWAAGWEGGMGVEGRFGNILAYSVCKPHNCSSYYTEIFIDMNSGDMQACWSTIDTGDIWLGAGSPRSSGIDCNTNRYTWTLSRDFHEKDPVAPSRMLFNEYGAKQ